MDDHLQRMEIEHPNTFGKREETHGGEVANAHGWLYSSGVVRCERVGEANVRGICF